MQIRTPNYSGCAMSRSTTILGAPGIFVRDDVAWIEAGARVGGDIPGIQTLMSAGELWGASQLWVHESGLDELAFPRALTQSRNHAPIANAYLDEQGPWQSSVKGLAPHSYWFRKGGVGIDLNVPTWAPDSPFRGLSSAEALWEQANALWSASGGQVIWKGSATITSDAMIRRQNRGLVTSPLPAPMKAGRGGELAFSWRTQTPEQGAHGASAHTCYAFDLNLAYLNGASSLALGTGEMILAQWDDAPRPGWWLVEVPQWSASLIPTPWSEQGFRRTGPQVWMTTPSAKLAVELGGYVIEGWAFVEPHRHLDKWYKSLRDARSSLLSEKGAAYEAIKQVAQHGLGRLGSVRRKNGADDPLYQPYWREAVIAEMRTRLFRRIQKLKRFPVAIDVDCCYFLTNAKTPESFAEWAGIPLGEGLGQFKIAGTMRAADARQMLNASTPTALENLRKGMTAAQ